MTDFALFFAEESADRREGVFNRVVLIDSQPGFAIFVRIGFELKQHVVDDCRQISVIDHDRVQADAVGVDRVARRNLLHFPPVFVQIEPIAQPGENPPNAGV